MIFLILLEWMNIEGILENFSCESEYTTCEDDKRLYSTACGIEYTAVIWPDDLETSLQREPNKRHTA